MRLSLPEYPVFMRWCNTILSTSCGKKRKPIKNIFERAEFRHIPVEFRKDKHGWSGKDGMFYLTEDLPVISQLHEAFHYLLCPKDRLKYNDFGLGVGFESFGLTTKLVIHQNEADIEEIAVCILTLRAASRVGIARDIIKGEMELASMHDLSEETYYQAMDRIAGAGLERHGFILGGRGL